MNNITVEISVCEDAHDHCFNG